MRRTWTLAACSALFPVAPAAAQSVQPWPDLAVSAPIGGGWIASGEVIGRIAGNERPSQLELRAQIGHPVGKRMTLWAGYVHVATYNPARRDGIENQLVEQLNWTIGEFGGVRFSSRTRLEQRALRGDDRVAWRLREQLRAAVPIGWRRVNAIVWTEPFVSLNKTDAIQDRYDQLRTFVGVTVPLTSRADFEVGYLRQHLHRSTGNVDNDAVPIALTLRF